MKQKADKNWSPINKNPPLIWHHHQIKKQVVVFGGIFSYHRMVFLIGKLWVEFSLANMDSPKSDFTVCLTVLNPVLSRYIVLSKYTGYNIMDRSLMHYMVWYIIYVFIICLSFLQWGCFTFLSFSEVCSLSFCNVFRLPLPLWHSRQ